MNDYKVNIQIAAVFVGVIAIFAIAIFFNKSGTIGTWVNTSDPSSIIEVAHNHIVHRINGTSTIYRSEMQDFKYTRIGNENCTIEVNGDTLIIGGGKLAGAYRRVDANIVAEISTPSTPASSVVLSQKLATFNQKIQSLRDKYKVLEQDRLDITAALAKLGVHSSSDLTTEQSRRIATELAEVVVQQQELQTQFSDVQRIVDEGRSLQRRLAREELVNDGKISNAELETQSNELIEVLAKLDQKFQNTGTVNTQQAINKIVDEQLQKK